MPKPCGYMRRGTPSSIFTNKSAIGKYFEIEIYLCSQCKGKTCSVIHQQTISIDVSICNFSDFHRMLSLLLILSLRLRFQLMVRFGAFGVSMCMCLFLLFFLPAINRAICFSSIFQPRFQLAQPIFCFYSFPFLIPIFYHILKQQKVHRKHFDKYSNSYNFPFFSFSVLFVIFQLLFFCMVQLSNQTLLMFDCVKFESHTICLKYLRMPHRNKAVVQTMRSKENVGNLRWSKTIAILPSCILLIQKSLGMHQCSFRISYYNSHRKVGCTFLCHFKRKYHHLIFIQIKGLIGFRLTLFHHFN